MAAMHKILKAEKMANGLVLVVDNPDGKEERYIVADDGSAAYRTLAQASDRAAYGTDHGYREDPEPPRASTVDESGHEVEDEDEDYEDDGSILTDGRLLLENAAQFVNNNPGVGQFLGSMISGMNQAEAKRHRVKTGQAKKRK